MTERLDPTRPYGDRRQFDRRREDRAPEQPEAASTSNLPVPVDVPHAHEHTSPPPLDGPAAFAAQLLGQPGQRRGLRQPGTVDAARSAYLETEYSGPADRRPPKGLLKKTEI
ncbi:hypothetical protein GVN21_14820 [Caulobacter sp. SLTY]|uniref:hypothetical protein n=1 Tax=Caulobacter sp. SLTY TaxID=2683262 RepID=UPI001413009B|nr:hypothetical protein [Caulobacter sp. SLTY]NBB16634.1 hypothetical protein [Caulobacter sp. SLTY]